MTPVLCGEGGIEGWAREARPGFVAGGGSVDEGIAHSRGDLRVAVLGGGADQRQGDAGDGGQAEAGGEGGRTRRRPAAAARSRNFSRRSLA